MSAGFNFAATPSSGPFLLPLSPIEWHRVHFCSANSASPFLASCAAADAAIPTHIAIGNTNERIEFLLSDSIGTRRSTTKSGSWQEVAFSGTPCRIERRRVAAVGGALQEAVLDERFENENGMTERHAEQLRHAVRRHLQIAPSEELVPCPQ